MNTVTLPANTTGGWSSSTITFKKSYKYPPYVFCQHWATNVAQRAVTVYNVTTTTAEIKYYGTTDQFNVYWVAMQIKY